MPEDSLHFDRVAALYHAARPSYPPALYDHLSGWGALQPGQVVLELGPGTGQATRALLQRGVGSIDAVELGASMAAELRRVLPDPRLNVVIGNAHDVPLPAGHYDLVVAATSFHWLDSRIMVPRLARAMRPGGALAVWWTLFGDAARVTPFRTGLRQIESVHGLITSRPLAPLDTDARLAELVGNGLFGNGRHELLRWTVQMDAAQTVALFRTFPTWAAEEAALSEVGALVGRLGGRITDHFMTALYCVWRSDRGN